MKNTGVSRKIDDLGRLVLPAEIRRRFGLNEGAYVDISVEGDQIILSKVDDGCVFCGGTEGLRSFRDRDVCSNCAAQISGQSQPAY